MAVAALLALQARQAEGHLNAARDRLPELAEALLDGDEPAVDRLLLAVQRDAAAARALTAGPLWDAAAALPWVGDTPRAVRAVTVAAEELTADVLPPLVQAADELRPARLLPEPDRVDLAAVSAAGAPLARAAARLDAVAAVPRERLVLPAVASARDGLAADVDRLRRAVATGSRVSRLLPEALGAGGPRRYFVAFQTSAESRGTGGLVGAYGILLADRGRVSMPVLGTDTDLEPVRSQLDLGAEYVGLYGRDPELWGNSNLSPHFPYAARRWLDVWQRRTGQHLDGAVATDPVGLSHLLRAAGPVELPDGEQVGADDVVALTTWDLYARFDGREDERKDFLVTVAGAVVEHLLDGGADAYDLLDAARDVVDDGRLLAWSARPAEQAALSGSPVSGEVPQDASPYAAVVVNNAAGNKLDVHLHRAVTYELGRCADGQRETVVRVELRNAVPAGPLPAYASGRNDLPDGSRFERGSTSLRVGVYATVGAALRRAELDGRAVGVVAGRERTRPAFVAPVVLARGQMRTLVLHLVEPARGGAVRLPEQPLVVPQRSTVRDAGCPPEERAVSAPTAGGS